VLHLPHTPDSSVVSAGVTNNLCVSPGQILRDVAECCHKTKEFIKNDSSDVLNDLVGYTSRLRVKAHSNLHILMVQ